MPRFRNYACLFLLSFFMGGLGAVPAMAQRNGKGLVMLKPEKTSLKFTNKVREDDSLHVLVYEYLYNGHGIGVGDFNNDGLDDVFISGNTTPNKLFINLGNMQFKDITREAGVRGNGTWSTGVSVADVNGDGLADVYVCHSGKHLPDALRNELFINKGIANGNPAFEEKAREFGLDAPGTQSTQAAFFDYDRDGDLDMFLLNHSMNTYSAFLNTRQRRGTPDLRYGNRLFRNDVEKSGVFTDVTLQAGIINNALNYGLSVNIADINQDGWADIYTTSDYTEHDCYYVNNRDGTFTQSLQKSFPHISRFSMGADIADFNNDALPDVFTLDMLPEDNRRQKLLKGPDEYDQYHLLLDSGYYRQNMRNMLQLNRGIDPDGNVRFSDIGQLAGVSNTDWSWSGLFADFDSDGWKDLMITNGYLRDFTDMDFLKYTMPDAQLSEAAKGNLNFKTYGLVQKMPSNKLRNYLFRNSTDLRFQDVSTDWGFRSTTVSNAAVYADFDNDGDLDLLIGNNNEPVELWRNDLRQDHSWLQVRLKSNSKNRFALGAKIRLYQGEEVQYQELYPVRGFQSCVGNSLHFGLKAASIDSLIIEWPTGQRSVIREVKTNQVLNIDEPERTEPSSFSRTVKAGKFFQPLPSAKQIPFRHKENDFVDFKVEVLMPYQLSRMGPALAKADVNGDGLDDVFLGGAIGQRSQLFLQEADGSFKPALSSPWSREITSEDVNALFLDADIDGDPDLYVVSGGNEYEDGSIEFQDRLYINDGKGVFTRVATALPLMKSNKQAIAAGDFDRDGDDDLFIGGRGRSGFFPEPSASYLLRNDSDKTNIRFTDVTESIPELRLAGMVTVADWSDLDGDGFPELIFAGDWMGVQIYRNQGGLLTNVSRAAGVDNLHGQWSALTVADISGDGLKDILLGNCGLNHQFKPTPQKPMTIHAADFDGNGSIDPIVSYFIGDKSYPLPSRDELLDQVPSLKKKFVKYADYADQTVESIFGREKMSSAKTWQCTETESIALLQGKGLTFTRKSLPIETQFSATYSILAEDLDNDEKTDLMLFGNFFPYRTQMGESDASYGLVLKGHGDGRFQALTPEESGLWANGDVRKAIIIGKDRDKSLVIGRNDDAPLIITFKKQ